MNMYMSIREFAGLDHELTIALQYAESFSTYSEQAAPWDLQGSFLSDISLIKGLVLQQSLWYCCSLRLAVLFDAPAEVRERIIADGQPCSENAAMLTYGAEWRFYTALHLLRTNHKDSRIREVREYLGTMPLSKCKFFPVSLR